MERDDDECHFLTAVKANCKQTVENVVCNMKTKLSFRLPVSSCNTPEDAKKLFWVGKNW